ncbi:hypothetical protein QAD02_013077 [Eretmocerus hayati]|uniref:Uncharacterized protein n=1 Tax=Eretmocerus hayati TaxID=131215 RepID=A0ACC2P131_9HYME|nr:hypothetical protein QAD02_013077 [Eretmocerus hayati]
MRVNIHPNSNSDSSLQNTASAMITMQNDLNSSQNDTLEIAETLRRVTRRRKMIESDLKPKLSAKIHSVDKFFETKRVEFIVKNGSSAKSVEFIVRYCKDLSDFVEYVKKTRSVTDPMLKYGLDFGRGSLKICSSIQNLSDHDFETELNKSRMGAPKQFLDSGLRKSFILGLVESCQENHGNISKLWSLIGLNRVPGKYSVDLKVANLLAGIMPHGAAFPCKWCYAPRGSLWKPCPDMRMIGNIKEDVGKNRIN